MKFVNAYYCIEPYFKCFKVIMSKSMSRSVSVVCVSYYSARALNIYMDSCTNFGHVMLNSSAAWS